MCYVPPARRRSCRLLSTLAPTCGGVDVPAAAGTGTGADVPRAPAPAVAPGVCVLLRLLLSVAAFRRPPARAIPPEAAELRLGRPGKFRSAELQRGAVRELDQRCAPTPMTGCAMSRLCVEAGRMCAPAVLRPGQSAYRVNPAGSIFVAPRAGPWRRATDAGHRRQLKRCQIPAPRGSEALLVADARRRRPRARAQPGSGLPHDIH